MGEKENKNVETLEEKKEEPVLEEKKEEPVLENQDAAQPKKKKGKGGVFAVIFIILIVGVLAALFVPSLLKPKNESKKASTDATEVSSPYRMSGNGLENFDLYFLQLENEAKNKVYSPLSIKYALAMLNEGTAGASHAQIAALIGDYKAKKYNNNEHMSFANSMFIKETYKDAIKQEYTNTLKEKYGAEVFVDPFTSPDPMNNWISDKTFHLIGNMLDDSVAEYDFFIINALAIDMNWVNQLQCESTQAKRDGKVSCKYYTISYLHENYADSVRDLDDKPGSQNYDTIDFNGGKAKSLELGASINNYDIVKTLGEDNIRKTVGEKLQEYIDNGGEMCGKTYDEYMDDYIKAIDSNYKRVDSSTDFYLYDNSELKAFAKDLQTYDGQTLQYVAVMPKEAELATYVKELDAKSLNNIIKNLKDIKVENFKEGVVTKIRGHIPVFKYDYQLNLKKDLQELGVKDIFSANDADLSNMIKTKGGEYISKADHKATIDFSNDGIKASAVTIFGGKGSSACETFEYKYDVPVETIDISFNKPYLYLIRDKDTGEVWFVGTVYEPTK